MNLAGTLLACATCYGAKDAAQTQGMNLAILTLLAVTGVVLAGFALFLITLARRARRYAERLTAPGAGALAPARPPQP